MHFSIHTYSLEQHAATIHEEHSPSRINFCVSTVRLPVNGVRFYILTFLQFPDLNELYEKQRAKCGPIPFRRTESVHHLHLEPVP